MMLYVAISHSMSMKLLIVDQSEILEMIEEDESD